MPFLQLNALLTRIFHQESTQKHQEKNIKSMSKMQIFNQDIVFLPAFTLTLCKMIRLKGQQEMKCHLTVLLWHRTGDAGLVSLPPSWQQPRLFPWRALLLPVLLVPWDCLKGIEGTAYDPGQTNWTCLPGRLYLSITAWKADRSHWGWVFPRALSREDTAVNSQQFPGASPAPILPQAWWLSNSLASASYPESLLQSPSVLK